VDEVYQGAVALFYLEDCSYKEIAEILEVAEGTVKSRISRGIAQLRHLLGYSVPTPSRPRANPENREETTLVNDEIAQMSKSHECSMR
jgi:transposase